MKNQAKRCTRKELSYLTYWRQQGYMLSIDDPIPLSTLTKPSFSTRRPILEAILGALIIVSAMALTAAWLGKAARLY
jgi:hypothetical protein